MSALMTDFVARTRPGCERRRINMRAFIVACVVACVIAVSAAAILDNFVQETARAAFAEPSARI
jgi:hypothetical protein